MLCFARVYLLSSRRGKVGSTCVVLKSTCVVFRIYVRGYKDLVRG